MKVVLASKNKHKWEEIRKITEKLDIQLVMESDLGVDIDLSDPLNFLILIALE